jgi:predicted amidohydrolase
MNIRLAQINPSLGNLQKNFELLQEYIRQAKKDRIDCLVFPELSLTGYFLKDQVTDCAEESTLLSEQVARLSKDIDLVFGAVEQNERFYNGAFYASAGKIIHTHRKVYLPTYGMFDEKRYFSEGTSFRTIDTKLGKIAILICEDAWHISSAYLAAVAGAETLIILSASPFREKVAEYWQSINKMYAEQFTLNVIYCNRVGVEDGVTFWGGSEAYAAGGTLLGRAPLLKEAILDITLNQDTVQQRLRSPFVRDERPEIVLKELQRIWHERR